jgi:hypothetical protein
MRSMCIGVSRLREDMWMTSRNAVKHGMSLYRRSGGSNRHYRRGMALVKHWLYQRGSTPVADVVHGLTRT